MREFILDKSHYTLPNYHQSQNRTPYPFQMKAFEALDNLKRKNPEGFATMLVLPTGAGKTYTAAHWVLKNYINKGVKVLWIAHRSELLRQAAEAFYRDTTDTTLPNRNSFTSYVVSSEFGRCCNIKDSKPDLLIASRQSLCSSSNMDYVIKWAKGTGLKANRKLLIVLDEAHHAAAASYRNIIITIKKYVPMVDILGLTATPYRTAKSEQGSLKGIFSTGSGIVYSVDMNTLISAGILANPKHIEVSTNVDMTQLFDGGELQKIARNDLTSLDEKSLKKLNENTERNRLIVDTYLARRKEFGQTIVFAVDVLNAIALNAIFQSAGVRSDFVVSSVIHGMGRSSATERNPQVIRDFKNGKLEVLINVNIVTEGTDIPNIQTVFLARPTTSKILMTQMIGRGLRGEAAGGTKETQIVYFVDEWKGLVDFVSPKALLDGDDELSARSTDRKKMLKHYIHMAEIEQYAVNCYETKPVLSLSYNNIIPYGIMKCNYISTDDYGEELEYSCDVVVFDEAAEIYNNILEEVPVRFCASPDTYTQRDIESASAELFFKYCECGNGAFIDVQPYNDRKKLYQNEIDGATYTFDYISNYNTMTYINVFDSEKEFDTIEKVHFETTSEGAQYIIFNIPLNADNTPVSDQSKWVEIGSGTVDYKGYHSIDTDDFKVNSEKFAIGVQLIDTDNSGNSIGVDEWLTVSGGNLIFVPQSKPGMSYFVCNNSTPVDVMDYYLQENEDDIGGTFIIKAIGSKPEQLKGDVDGNGILSIFDTTAIQLYLARMMDFTDEQMYIADFDGDGVVSIFDATLIQLEIANVSTDFEEPDIFEEI